MDQAAQEYLDQRPRYWLCTAAFGAVAFSTVLLSIYSGTYFLGYLSAIVHRDGTLLDFLQKPFWTFAVALPSLYAALIGSYLLWGRWPDPSWQRRAGAYLFVCAANAGLGTLLKAERLGLDLPPIPEEWMLGGVFEIFGWTKLWLAASLASEVASHLGLPTARALSTGTARFAMIGLGATALYFLIGTDWRAGLPLRPHGQIRNEATLLLMISPHPIRCLCAGQVAALCFLAARECRRTWLEIGQWEATGSTWGGNWRERGD